jgi:hypothetical protein
VYKRQGNAGGDFYVYPRFITGYSGSDIKVVFSSDGVHVKKFPLYLGFFDNGDDYFYPLSGASSTASGGSTITTSLTETVSSQISNTPDLSSILTVSKDGTYLFTVNVRSILAGTNINDQVRHGGAGSDTVGFVVKGFTTDMLDNSTSILSGSEGIAGDASQTDILAAPSFLSTILAIFGLTSSSVVPFWLWAIIAIPCISTLTYMYLEMLRGN